MADSRARMMVSITEEQRLWIAAVAYEADLLRHTLHKTDIVQRALQQLVEQHPDPAAAAAAFVGAAQ